MISKHWQLLLLLFISALVIFYKFLLIPRYLFFDEVEFAKLAISLSHTPYLPYSELATGHSTLYFYVLLFSMKVFGLSTFALRLPSALFGIVSIFVLYRILKNAIQTMEHQWLPFVCSLIFVTSRWYFNFARYAFEGTFLITLELSSILFFLEYIKHKSIKYLIFSGIFAGLTFHSYIPGRIFFIVPLFFLVRYHWKQILWFLIPFLVVIAPLVMYLTTHQDLRVKEQMYLTSNRYPLPEKIGFFATNVLNTTLMFNVIGDMNGRHNYPGKPALNPFIGILFLIGLFSSLKHLDKKRNQLFILYFIVSLIPTLLTAVNENPNMLRTITALPAVAYFAGNGIASLVTLSKNYRKLIVIGITALLLFSMIYELRTYFLFQDAVFKDDAFKIRKNLDEVISM
jgi:4-amino-4-deoxy-L-arabinose transferase-like glycosyltransferase